MRHTDVSLVLPSAGRGYKDVNLTYSVHEELPKDLLPFLRDSLSFAAAAAATREQKINVPKLEVRPGDYH